jgi:hypothetical protein
MFEVLHQKGRKIGLVKASSSSESAASGALRVLLELTDLPIQSEKIEEDADPDDQRDDHGR